MSGDDDDDDDSNFDRGSCQLSTVGNLTGTRRTVTPLQRKRHGLYTWGIADECHHSHFDCCPNGPTNYSWRRRLTTSKLYWRSFLFSLWQSKNRKEF